MTATVHNTGREERTRNGSEMERAKERKQMRLSAGSMLAAAAADASHGFQRVTAENLQQVFGFLTMSERFAVISTQKAMMKEPMATRFTSYCNACEQCTMKNAHLCTGKDNGRSEGFWKCLLRQGCGELIELRVANSDAFTKDVVADPACRVGLEKLHVLEINRCSKFDTEGLVGLQFLALAQVCCNLEALHLRDMAVEGVALQALVNANKKTLRVVDLTGCHTLSGHDIRCISECSRLRDLGLSGCHNVDNASVIHVIERCSNLTRLNLRYCHKVDDRVVAIVAENLPGLKDLNLRYCYKVSDKGVDSICQLLPHLENLNLSQCSRVTDAAISRIVASLSNLKELRLWGCTKLTSAAVYEISAGMPSLTLMDIRSRDKFEAVIGGQTALKFLIQTYRNTLAKWEQTAELGVFKRPMACVAVA
ncbi:TPA: hypothetical protein N0F65_009915 [Lagenidium giganteum]|uniref:Uncharacterized protein n=1 Tax=Lagenidium giganteum TaxID=4803 RepID=A0AAV2YKH1_9STRA|nr:TPA: hypothetical protein N0F65_009915 [Lagenidium giganteum]